MQRRAHRENQVSSRTQRVEVRNACSPRYPTVHAALHLRQLSLVPRRRGLLLRQRQELERGGSQGLQVHRVREPQGVRSDQGLLLRLSLIHISEPTRLGMISYAVFCLKKKTKKNK